MRYGLAGAHDHITFGKPTGFTLGAFQTDRTLIGVNTATRNVHGYVIYQPGMVVLTRDLINCSIAMSKVVVKPRTRTQWLFKTSGYDRAVPVRVVVEPPQ